MFSLKRTCTVLMYPNFFSRSERGGAERPFLNMDSQRPRVHCERISILIAMPDDVATIPAALRMIGTGAARILFPVVVRQPALVSGSLCIASHQAARVGAGMALAAAH